MNLSTAEAVADIMDGLSEYVPMLLGKPHQVLYSGDGLNTDRVEPSRTGPDGSTAEPQTFEGLLEAPSEFHKESLCYQVTYPRVCCKRKFMQQMLETSRHNLFLNNT